MRRRGRGRIVNLVILILLSAGAYTVMESPVFRLHELEVVGGSQVTPEEVWAWSGLVPGEHLLAIRAGDLSAVLARHPRVRAAAIRASLPGRLTVTLEERKAVLLVAYHQGFLEVDGEGWVIGWQDQVGDRPLPVATGLSLGEVAVGERAPGGGLQIVLDLSLGLGVLRQELSEISLQREQLTAYTMDGVVILWGDAHDAFEDKLEILMAFLSEGEGDARYLDLRVPSRPVVGR